MSDLIRISMTTWFANDKLDKALTCHGIVGHLTEEQYNIAKGWICQLAEWTDDNRGIRPALTADAR